MAEYRLPTMETLFAFNRNIATAEGATDDEVATLVVAGAGRTYSDTRTVAAAATCRAAFQHYLQLLFDIDEVARGNTTVVADVSWGDVEGHYTVYWGAVSAGERLGDRTLRYYPALDNPVPLWVFEGATLLRQLDNGVVSTETVLATTLTDGRSMFSRLATGHIAHITQQMDNVLSTFDETFDYTFWAFGKDSVLRNDIIVDCATTGVYLKWIDGQGCWYYWLFEPYTRSVKTKAVGDDYETFFEDTDMGYYGVVRPRGYTTETTQTIVAPMVSVAERRVLDTLLSSPLVYWCPDVSKIVAGDTTTGAAEWLAVRIVAGTTRDELAAYADYEVTVQYPDKTAQVL